MILSVVIPAHNPHRERLQRTLAGLRTQLLPVDKWEIILVDNCSSPALAAAEWAPLAPANFRIVPESALGLTAARLRGIAASNADMLVFVDDDNVLAPDYLANVVRHFARDPGLGALGGRVVPEFETEPDSWVAEFRALLALRDCGDASMRASWPDAKTRQYPGFAPIGAGMAIRRALALDYSAALATDLRRRSLDRTGDQLISGGDNDLVMHVLEAGFAVGYEPDLSLTHLIPTRRIERRYLGTLNRAIARSWVRVLALHGLEPWRPIAPATVRFRQWRAWWRTQAWRDAAAWVTWQGMCGTFEGQADLARLKALERMHSSATG